MKMAVERLYSRTIKIDGAIRWIYRKEYVKNEGKIMLCLSSEIILYLSLLSDKFTAYKLKYVTQFKSSYSHIFGVHSFVALRLLALVRVDQHVAFQAGSLEPKRCLLGQFCIVLCSCSFQVVYGFIEGLAMLLVDVCRQIAINRGGVPFHLHGCGIDTVESASNDRIEDILHRV
ncbi:RepB family plasmid replication initiator protein [Methylotuvimicrobium buryatense]|uniref:RepB family plasmid replication initiator protein n=1 Tax=Methylotuvimicrobium buryatense TaxID=95641 RepID=A0A4P9URW0_METBY|nr:RepB family plasmid replication initiator protein [Methylotuvimicrobium buryatense]